MPSRPRPIAAIAVAGLIGVSACATGTDDGASSTPAPTTPTSTSSMTSPVLGDQPIGVTATITGAPAAPLAAALHLELDRAAQIEVAARSGDHLVTLPMSPASAVHDIPVIGLYPDHTYEISVTALIDDRALATTVSAGTDPIEFTTPPLPDWFPEHEITVDTARTAPGYTLVESSPNGYGEIEGAPDNLLIAYDDAGQVAWYTTNFGGLGGIEQTANGTFLSHYWPFGIRELDVFGNVISNWQPAVSRGDGADSPDVAPTGNTGEAAPVQVVAPWVELRSFHHENWPMPNGNVLALSTTLHELTPEQRAVICPGDDAEFSAISDVVVEFAPDGTVERTWDVWDVIDIVEHPGSAMCEGGGLFADELARDWTHANSVVYDPDRDAILVSVRHTDQIVALDHLDAIGPQTQLRWILGAGGTIPLDGEPTYHQHAVEVLDDGAIIVYDNGNGRPGTSRDDPDRPPYSRAVIYDIDDADDDPATWSATQRWEYLATDESGAPVYTGFIGDADQLDNGNVLITFGGIGSFPSTPDDPLHGFVVEVVPNGPSGGEIVWQLTTDPSSIHTIYRSERIVSFFPPT